MRADKLLVIGLDGYESSIADRLMSEGRLPNLAHLKSCSSRFFLEHGKQKYSGLAWEHFSTGMTPELSGRWSGVAFDPRTYQVVQKATTFEPLLARVAFKSVVFDAPYFDIGKATQVRGLVNWGAHDPGIATMARPRDLIDEITAKFGRYPAADYIYGFTWPSVSRTQAAGNALVAALDQRTEISRWLFCERMSDWDLALVVVSELHSVIEPMWHGLDPLHPLHEHKSAAPARLAIERVYETLDRLVGTLVDSIPNAAAIAFSMHGMGPNTADVPAMLLLPELLYRLQFGHSLYEPRAQWRASDGPPLLDETEGWENTVKSCFKPAQRTGIANLRSLVSHVPRWISSMVSSPIDTDDHKRLDLPLDWMPAACYQPHWPRMRAFALPAFYDGRIRINLMGRERHGMVRLSDYHAVCGELIEVLMACRDSRTGAPVVASIEKCCSENPLALDASNADLAVVWQGSPLALLHKDFGSIGPAPFRRTGGHTGGHGVFYAKSRSLPAGDQGIRSSFDVAPTILELLGQPIPPNISGRSLLAAG
jgi:predicted AlkP superfamily phosphohydrolase/phosphomutase